MTPLKNKKNDVKSQSNGSNNENEERHGLLKPLSFENNKKGGINMVSKLFENPISKWVVTTILGAMFAAGTYFIKTEYVPRKELEEKYILKKDFDNKMVLIDMAQKEFVNKEVYKTEVDSIKDSLNRIERSLDENNRVLREVIEKGK